MPVEPASPDELARFTDLIHGWTERERESNPLLSAVDHDAGSRRWFIRLRGEERAVTTVWLTLRERTLHYETQFMPAPEENIEACYEYLLRLNHRLFGMRFAIGDENAIYLIGQMPLSAIDEDELDRIIGATYSYAEQYFRPAMRIGYASKFRG